MKSSQIKFIRPQLLNNEVVSSWFSLRNHEKFNTGRNISGLNLGLNTNENEELIYENREFLLSEIGLEAHQIAFAIQVHKTKVQYVTQGGTFPNTDAFVTDKKNIALAIQVADCAAVLMADIKNKVIGASHAGWRGAVEKIVPKTIEKMQELGAKPENINVFVSPCISLDNFEVGTEVAKQFPDEFVDWERFKKPHVDMKGYINDQLRSMDILHNHIEVDDSCTIDDPSFYSYRRQKDKSGRMMGIIKLN